SMLMMFVVHVPMVMFQRRVPVLVRVPFGKMEPYPTPHQHCGDQKVDRGALAQSQYRDNCSNKGSEREIGTCPGRADVPQCQNKEHKAHPITDKTHHCGCYTGEQSRHV